MTAVKLYVLFFICCHFYFESFPEIKQLRPRVPRNPCHFYNVNPGFKRCCFLLLVQVDELMRQELANWKLAVDKEKSGKVKGAAKVQ